MIRKETKSPKKKNQKPVAVVDMKDDKDGDDSDDEQQDGNEELLAEHLENLSEKRSSTRGHAIEFISNVLRMHQASAFDILSNRSETLMYNVAALLKRPSSPTEAAAMYEFLTLIALTLPDHHEGIEVKALFLQYSPMLETAIKNDSLAFEARVAACEAFTRMAWLVQQTEDLEIEELAAVVAVIDATLDKPEYPPDLVRAAASGLCLLLTTMPQAQLAGSLFKKYIAVCSDLLSHPIQEVKVAGGELVALLQESALLCDSPDQIIDIDAASDDVIGKLSELANDSSRNNTKKNRAKQKSNFRVILKTVEEGEVPSEKMEIRKVTHEFEGWRSVLQLDNMRALLGAGLINQLVNNSILRVVFMIEVMDDEEQKQDAQQKQAGKKKQAIARQTMHKDKYQSIAKERKKKNAFRADFD